MSGGRTHLQWIVRVGEDLQSRAGWMHPMAGETVTSGYGKHMLGSGRRCLSVAWMGDPPPEAVWSLQFLVSFNWL